MSSNRRSWLLWGIATVAVAALAFAWFAPSNNYLFIPNKATPVGDKVTVEGERSDGESGGEDGGAIYYVDVNVRKATWFESFVPFVRPDGASLVPRDEVVPPGSTFEDRRAEGIREMARSERTAAAVALKQAGYPVKATPRGALVDAVAADAPAADVLRSGDVIIGVGNTDVRTPIALRKSFADAQPGDEIVLRIRRDGVVRKVTVKTIESPREPGKAIIGIRVSQDAKIVLPLEVDIDLGSVGGPSAGLPFALDVLQELGTDVDRGMRVVATGEIGLDGSIGPIGGVKQKTYGARRAGADVFLVPAGDNAVEARRYAGNLRIIPVTTFQQALSALAKAQAN